MSTTPHSDEPHSGTPAAPATSIPHGKVYGGGHCNRSQDPPTNGENYQMTETFYIPPRPSANGQNTTTEEPKIALLTVSYRVEDWGEIWLQKDGEEAEQIINLSSKSETARATGPLGGHTEWSDTAVRALEAGHYTLRIFYHNIVIKDEDGGAMRNRIVCEYAYKVVELEPGGDRIDTPCSCQNGICSIEGGWGTPAARSAEPRALNTSASAAEVRYETTEDKMLWSCNTGVLRGLGAYLNGYLRLYSEDFDASLAAPSALVYEHPMLATLSIPEGGIVPGARVEIRQGCRVIAFRCYEDGSIAPIGIDTAGRGMVTLEQNDDGTVRTLRWQDNTGAAWVFDGESGELASYTSPEMVTIENAADLPEVKRSADDSYIRQIRSRWDGLLNVEDVNESGYTIRLYTPAAITGTDADGYYTVASAADAFKSFTVAYAETGLTITEATPGREPYSCTWFKTAEGAWNMTKGSSAAEQITTTRTRTILDPTSGDDVWQLVTTVSKGGVAASCVAEVYRTTPVGNLLLSRTEGYGTAAAQTTTYEYDGTGNLRTLTTPTGHTTKYNYDDYGRLLRTTEPWRGGNYTLLTEYSYANTSESRYSAEIATVTQWVWESDDTVMQQLSNETHTYSVAGGIKREEIRRTAAGSPHTRLEITETWTDDAPTPLEKGRIRMTQAENGVQTWYSYTPTALHGAIYTITTETRVDNAPVAGQSRRRVTYITAAGNTVREEEYLLLTTGDWEQIQGATHTYDIQNRRSGTVRDNGRSSSQEISCTGDTVWEIDEDGIRTDYTYDSARQLTEISRAAVYDGDTCITPETITEYTRDAAGRVLTVTRRIGAMTTTETTAYDTLGRVLSSTDTLGRVTMTSYSADGLTTTVTTPAGATLITTVNTDGSTARVAGTGQRELHYRYDISNSCTRETVYLADGVTLLSQTLTDGFGQTQVTTAPTTRPNTYITTHSTYNALGQLTQQSVDGQAPVLYAYDTMGNVCRQTVLLDAAAPEDATRNRILTRAVSAVQEADGVYQVVTTARNNAAGTMLGSTQKTLISESVTLESKSVSVDERGNTSTSWGEYGTGAARTQYSTIPGSALTAQSVSVDGFTISSVDHAGITTSASRRYTESGIEHTQTDGRGNTATTRTDIAGRTISVTDAAGNTTATAYCACCDNPALITDPLGHTSCFRYDERGRKVAEWGTAIQPALFGYDDADRMTTLTTFRAGTETISVDPAARTDGDTTTWTYDDATGMELSKTYADGHGTAKTYDAYNRLATLTNARGTVQTNTYHPLTGLLTGMSFSDATTPQSFEYNILGQLTQVTDAAGTRTFAYNEYGEQAADSVTVNETAFPVVESRDSIGRSAGYSLKCDTEDIQVVSYGYGTDGRLNTAGFLHNGQQKQFGYSYLQGTNLLQTLTMPNNMSLTQSYEPQRDLLTQMAYRRSNTLVAQRTYVYDAAARPTERSIARNGTTRNDVYTYNDRSELISDVVDGTGLNGWDYDNIGNRLMEHRSDGYEVYTSNELNQYTAVTEPGGTFTPAYDLDGNQTRIKTSTGIWLATYNALNRPVRFESEDGSIVITADYDYMGRRVFKKVESINEGTATTTSHLRFLYRGYLQIAALDLTRPTLTPMWFITWDPTQPTATRPLAIQKDGTWFAYGWDLTKNICEVYGQAGYIRTAYTYTAYGTVTADGDVEQPIQWSSEYNDTELGLVYYNFRHYNPADGRWIGRDFIGEASSVNIYCFVDNKILSSYDLRGNSLCCDECTRLGLIDSNVSINVTSEYGHPTLVDNLTSFYKVFSAVMDIASEKFDPVNIVSDVYVDSVGAVVEFLRNHSNVSGDKMLYVYGKAEYTVCEKKSCFIFWKKNEITKKETRWLVESILPGQYADADRALKRRLRHEIKKMEGR